MTAISPTELLLIQAAIAPVPEAARAWDQWRRFVGSSDPLPQEQQILPSVAANLQGHLSDDVLRPALVARRRTAVNNLRTVAALNELLEALQVRNIEPVVLKGAAMMSSAYFDDLGARNMCDVDLLVAPAEVVPAIEILERLAMVRWKPEIPLDALRSVMHAATFQGPLGEIDLHWTLLYNGRDTSADAEFRSRSVPARLGSREILVPSPTDLAFHLLAHGESPDLRWVVDVMAVLLAGEVDVDQVAASARSRRYLAKLTANAAAMASLVECGNGSAIAELRAALANAEPLPGDVVHGNFTTGNGLSRPVAFARFVRTQSRAAPGGSRVQFIKHLAQYASESPTFRGSFRPAAMRKMLSHLAPGGSSARASRSDRSTL